MPLVTKKSLRETAASPVGVSITSKSATVSNSNKGIFKDHFTIVTLDHKTSHKGQLFEIEIIHHLTAE